VACDLEVTEVTGNFTGGHGGPGGRHRAQLDDAGAADAMASSTLVSYTLLHTFTMKNSKRISLQ
jgi:hypothetical protein